MQDVNLFSGHVFDLSSEDFKMSTEEKHSIALQYYPQQYVALLLSIILKEFSWRCIFVLQMCITQSLMSGGKRKTN